MVAGVRLPGEKEPRLEKGSAGALRDLRQITGNYWAMADEVKRMENALRRTFVSEKDGLTTYTLGGRSGMNRKEWEAAKAAMAEDVSKARAKMAELKAEHRARMTEARAELPLEFWQWVDAWKAKTLEAIAALAQERKSGASSVRVSALADAQEALRRRFSEVTGVDFEVRK